MPISSGILFNPSHVPWRRHALLSWFSVWLYHLHTHAQRCRWDRCLRSVSVCELELEFEMQLMGPAVGILCELHQAGLLAQDHFTCSPRPRRFKPRSAAPPELLPSQAALWQGGRQPGWHLADFTNFTWISTLTKACKVSGKTNFTSWAFIYESILLSVLRLKPLEFLLLMKSFVLVVKLTDFFKIGAQSSVTL